MEAAFEAAFEPQKGAACSTLSLQAGEPLIGTATQTSVYMLLEYNGAWEAKAFERSDLSDRVKTALGAALKAIPGSRLLFIRGGAKHPDSGIHFYLASLGDEDPALYGYNLAGYEDILNLDIAGILSGASTAAEHRLADPLFLVCVNGRRDPCCARYGVSFFAQVQQLAGEAAWQCTHVGGHRFAANLVCLPHGLFYGRLRPEDAGKAVESCRNGQIWLPHLRGRACYPEVVQAAEAFLHERTGDLNVDAFLWMDSIEVEPGIHAVRFRSAHTGQIYRLHLTEETSAGSVLQSCGTDTYGPILFHNLLEIE